SSAHHALTRAGLLEVNAFTRRTTTRTRNGDESPYESCEENASLLCVDDSDEVVVDPRGEPFGRTAEHPLDAVLNRSTTAQTSIGASAQLSRPFRVFGDDHRASLGLSYDRGSADFALDAEVANLTETRAAEGVGRIAADSIVRLDATTSTASAYITDVVTATPRMTITAAARFNRSTIRLRDRAGDDLSGDHRFTSVNPSLGLTWAAGALTLFASLAQASRTPTPVELTCANPDDPCRLPNAFVSDPPLEQVTARTAEAGVRGRAGRTRWSMAAFQTMNEDDILFISSGRQRGHGYFTNVGQTLRRGLEAAVDGAVRERLQWHASYSLIDATFERAFVVASPHHPLAQDGELHVSPGDRLPLIPRHTAKIGANLRAAATVQLSADARYTSSAFLRGDEANLAPPLRNALVLDLGATVGISPRVMIELTLTNATNAEYETFGTFGDASEVLGDEYDDPTFVSPGRPRAVRVSVRFRG
ncbi:MAG TPA: TonB-dependent receptor, partial [Thermoanaerobaculia bacterium]|nr:TonB-dependent receptor [Thermoanaerobaculia bacterium]